jgi:hypothetical protein
LAAGWQVAELSRGCSVQSALVASSCLGLGCARSFISGVKYGVNAATSSRMFCMAGRVLHQYNGIKRFELHLVT